MSLVEGMRASVVHPLIDHPDDPTRVEDGPRGALVVLEEVAISTQMYDYLSEVVPAPVYHVEFDPRDGRFACLRLEKGKVQWQFDTGDSWMRTGAPQVPDVEGETTPLGIVRKLGMPESLVALEVPAAKPAQPELTEELGSKRPL